MGNWIFGCGGLWIWQSWMWHPLAMANQVIANFGLVAIRTSDRSTQRLATPLVLFALCAEVCSDSVVIAFLQQLVIFQMIQQP